ncbi:SurA N-terminal domain-containing protein [Methylocystis sp. MJC1]|jgi:peptidyl-prolyl cis-trans isomerase D|uniref:SurA N-terminal domain-containing protein n=1 Tax=Methylocystis sp. MJC1 TaxID=2654282 RepID=UPI0013EA1D2F|nr:SurA N-terminal domain-containing protein [Methylocystis sp. MJC1]KAF2989229.1 Peptidyl-prolyl cis-trans isomerase D [Methylocystis sp. MJC1]MBU6526956.1 SurA N-terminal domain-containing protein [Methylocystis sp. MJC1]UZX13392.1 SurA N-terminal domain-containing protein [Methylocystis sp. MJC1]
MLEGLRVASQNWIGRAIMAVVMGVIVISFAIWGVGDVFRGMTSQRLAKVGSGEVTVDQFRTAFQNDLRRIQQRLRRAVTAEEAHKAGMDLQVLERLITDVALDQKTRNLGLAASDDTVQRLISNEKAFQTNGKFDAEKFKAIARDNGYTERSFVADQKGAYLRKTLTDLVINGVEPPKLMIEAIHRFRNEARSIDYFILPVSAAGEAKAPSDEDLKKYFDDREQSFRAKEYRKITVLEVSPATVAKAADISDADARKLYDEVKTKRFGAPEKREVRQLVFKTDKEAEEAIGRLKGGMDVDALAAELKRNPKDVDLGLVEQRDFGDAKVGSAVFALPQPGVAEPVTTTFGTVVSVVKKISPAVVSKTYEQVANLLKAELAQQKAAPEVRRLHEAVEDQRASGKTLSEAAAAVGVKTRVIDAVDDAGNGKDGKSVDVPAGADLLKAAFASDIGVDNETVATRDGGYVWFEINGVEPARQKTFEEVKGAVAEAMRAESAQKALTAKADDIVAKIKGGQPIDAAAKELTLDVQRATEVRRAQRPDFNTNTIVQFFEVAPGGAGSVSVDGGRLIFVVKDAQTPPFDPSSIESKTIAEQLKPALQNDLLEQYVGGLEKSLNVEINEKALQMATGAEKE